MPTPEARSGPVRNRVWRIVQWPVSVFFRLWAPLVVEGLENIDPTKPGLLVANHQSYLDPLLLAVRMDRPVSYVARDSLFRVPGLGWLLRNTHVTPISRTAARAATIRAALQRLEEGFLVGIFPEGTRSSDGVSEFRPGVAAILKRCDVPVYPVGIAGADRVWPRGSWFIRPRRIRVVFGPAIPAGEMGAIAAQGSKSELVDFVRKRVVELHDAAQENV